MPTCRSTDTFSGRKFIFVHVPKTAGVSMTTALEGNIVPFEQDLDLRASILDTSFDIVNNYQGTLFWHITADDLIKYYGEAYVRDYYSFGFIRNPWDWLVSMYSYIRQHKNHPESMICGHMTFKQFLRYFASKKITQSTFLTSGGSVAVDKIYRLEDLPEALKEIQNITGLSFDNFPLENKSDHKNYVEFYDREDIDLVHKAFQSDIALGEYSFNDKIKIQYKNSENSITRFILDGTPRSGTTALMSALSMHINGFCCNERFQIFADHSQYLSPKSLLDPEIPPAFPGEAHIHHLNIEAYIGSFSTPNDAYPYLNKNDENSIYSNRKLSAFGNKTPRYYFNASEICTDSSIKYVSILRNPIETAGSWDARAVDSEDMWLSVDIGLLAILEYLQQCYVILQIDQKSSFIAIYDIIFFDNSIDQITSLLKFLNLDVTDEYIERFQRYFLRQVRRRPARPDTDPIGAVLKAFCTSIRSDELHAAFTHYATTNDTQYRLDAQKIFDSITEDLDNIIKLYFESALFFDQNGIIARRIITDQSLFFAKARFQSFLTPGLFMRDTPHLHAWMTVILQHRRAFCASLYFSDALNKTSFNDSLKAALSIFAADARYIYSVLTHRGLGDIFKAAFESDSVSDMLRAADTLETSCLLEDAQILRYRALTLARGDNQRRAAAISFGRGEALVQSRLSIRAGHPESYLDMDALRTGFP